MSRTSIVAGNWKMNLDQAGSFALAKAVATGRSQAGGVDLVLCPPSIYIAAAGSGLEMVEGVSPSGVGLGGQNMSDQPSGAFTGEISAAMLLDMGCRYVILGHSERRTLLGETDAVVASKVAAALAAELTPIVCVGEQLAEREADRTHEVVSTQVRGSLARVAAEELSKVVIAYEPVWAIGTGKVATPEQAQEVHALIRSLLAEHSSREVAASIRIQYGGSVKPGNAADLAAQPDIDGALVGGASLEADGFLAIAAAFR
jgi:triosephosphate isomerase